MVRLYDTPLLGEPLDVSREFGKLEHDYFMAHSLTNFDPDQAAGSLRWERFARKPRLDFGKYTMPFTRTKSWEFPAEYPENPELPFRIDFIDQRTVRIRISARDAILADSPSLMLENPPVAGPVWSRETSPNGTVTYRGTHGSVSVIADPWCLEFRDAQGKLLTRTNHHSASASIMSSDPTPFCFVRSSADMRRHLAASFSLAPEERLYGGGESFTRLNKRGQKMVLWTYDALGAQSADMYKPIPFILSDRGYGMFHHHSCPMTFDLGHSFDGANTAFIGDDQLDLFFFFGDPKEVVSALTSLTGRSPVPPLWSFGLWMSRITYTSEEEIRGVAATLRDHRIPCDVVHADTGWFEKDWGCDFRFSTSRFQDAAKMIADLRQDGFRLSLWQNTYALPSCSLHKEVVEGGFAVKDKDGKLATDDAIFDFSSPATVAWYQAKLAGLLRMGVGAIKADFGESAPLQGCYASGKSGWFEHNLYPLRYNKAVADITREVSGESIIWARSAWAGSQRYPLHWGGDAECTDNGMAASLRAGLSFGLCGFSFWSHDIGGFVASSPRELYRRWLPFGMLSSHSRCHGAPPTEPWHYDPEFEDDFRRAVELKYRLMPYVYTQAALASAAGHPLVRPLFFDFPDDPGSWQVEDQYLFGQDILVAPLFEAGGTSRTVYLPPGQWIDYQSGQAHSGGGYRHLSSGEIPVIMLVRSGSLLPHLPLAQHTSAMDWSRLELLGYGDLTGTRSPLVAVPGPGAPSLIHLRVDLPGLAIVSSDSPAMTAGWRLKPA